MTLRLSNRSEEVSRRGYKSDQATRTPVLLTCKSCPAVKDIFTAKTRRARRKTISKTLRSSRLRGGFFGLRLGCSVFIGGCILCDLCRRTSLQLAKDFWRQTQTSILETSILA